MLIPGPLRCLSVLFFLNQCALFLGELGAGALLGAVRMSLPFGDTLVVMAFSVLRVGAFGLAVWLDGLSHTLKLSRSRSV